MSSFTVFTEKNRQLTCITTVTTGQVAMKDDIDDPRREFLVRALTAGLFAGSGGFASSVWGMGKVPKVIPPGKSFFDIKGDVRVNEVPATLDTFIKPNDVVQTGSSSHAVFVVGKDAFILQEK